MVVAEQFTMADADAKAGEAAARWCVLGMIALTLAVNVPMFICNTVFGDDWAWVWVHHWQGAGAIQHYLTMIAHPGFGPLINLPFLIGGDVPGRAARTMAVIFHLANGWMLWRIFREGRGHAIFGASVAILYLASPFLNGNRATLSHAEYDVFIFAYLASVRISGRRGVGAMIAAILCQAVALSIETLAPLEIVRWWYLWQRGEQPKAIAWRGAPYVSIVLALLIARLTVFVPGGYAIGHNAVEPLAIGTVLHGIVTHLHYYLLAMEPLKFVPKLFGHENAAIIVVLFLASAGVGFVAYRIPPAALPPRRRLALFVVGGVVLFAGMAPYVAAGRPPTWTGFYARLAVMSQFGVFILGAAVLAVLPGRAARGVAIALLVFLFSAMELQFGKWMLYDELVVGDFQSQLADEFAHHDPELLFVHFQPRSDKILFVGRCLANYDINVALNITGRDRGSFAYDADCQAAEYTADGKCGATAFAQTPCPPKWDADFRLRPGMQPFTRFRIADLARHVIDGAPLDAGDLIVDRSSGSVRVGKNP